MGHPIICTTFLSKRENTLLQWAFKLNSALATAENQHLKGCMIKVKRGGLDVRIHKIKAADFINNVQIQQNQHYPCADHPSMPLCILRSVSVVGLGGLFQRSWCTEHTMLYRDKLKNITKNYMWNKKILPKGQMAMSIQKLQKWFWMPISPICFRCLYTCPEDPAFHSIYKQIRSCKYFKFAFNKGLLYMTII